MYLLVDHFEFWIIEEHSTCATPDCTQLWSIFNVKFSMKWNEMICNAKSMVNLWIMHTQLFGAYYMNFVELCDVCIDVAAQNGGLKW